MGPHRRVARAASRGVSRRPGCAPESAGRRRLRRASGRRNAGSAMSAPDSAFVFNIVWTGRVFPYLKYFVASQMAQSGARFRFVSNGCPPDQVRLMKEFASAHADRIVEVLVTSATMD